MTIDAGEAAIRTVIAAALAEHSEASGRGLDALFAMQSGGANRECPQTGGVRDQAPKLMMAATRSMT
jgi:hypothetical protein